MKNYNLTFVIYLLCFIPLISFAQVYCNTNDGRQVILHDNGTWQYVPNSSNTIPTINSNQTEPGLDGCEDYEFGNVGFQNSTGREIFVVISFGASYSILQIPPSGLKWQKELGMDTYYFKVFTEKPDEQYGPYNADGFKYQGNVSVIKCKNKTIEIDF